MGFFSNIKNRTRQQVAPVMLGMPVPNTIFNKPKPKFDPKEDKTPINPDSFPRGKSGGFGTITLPDGTVVRGGKGPYGGSCPALNEEVLLADNKWISAKDLKVGDKVATHLGSNKVTHIDFLKDRIKKEVVFSDNDKEESIVTSDSHPYYVQNEEGFVEVKDLKVGDQVGNFKVKEIKDADKGSVVHISIDEAQTYYLKAGDKKVLSHNKRFLPPKEQTIEGIPISQLPFNPRVPGNLFPYKPKSKKRGGIRGIKGIFRKLQEQIRNQQRPQQMPQQDLDFLSRLPPNMMPEIDFSNLPQMSGNPNIPAPDGYELKENEKGMNYFRELLNPEDQAQNIIPRGIDIPFQDFNLQNMRPGFFGGRDVNIDDGGMVDFLNSDPQQKLFGIENRIGMLQNQLQEAEANKDRELFDMIVQEINNADAQRIEIMNSMNPRVDRMMEAGRGRTVSDMDRATLDDILSDLEKKN